MDDKITDISANSIKLTVIYLKNSIIFKSDKDVGAIYNQTVNKIWLTY
jgi:hypothetical protein